MSTANSEPRPVVVVGMDMGDGALIRHWAAAGELPNFQALIDGGTWLELDSPAKVLHTSSWPTFATGTLPGRHGVYYPYQPKPGHQQAQLIEPDQYGTPSFWHLADQDGRRCLVYDVPETFPEAAFGGRAIFEWGTWAWYGQPAAQPEGLMDELKAKFGPYPLGMEAKRLGLAKPDRPALGERLPKSVDHKVESLLWLMEREPWDLVVTAFCETHAAGHYLWPVEAIAVEGAPEERFRSLQSVYAAIDRALGRLRVKMPDTGVLMVVSGDGVRANHCGWHLLPAVLERLGHTNAPAEGDHGGQPAAPRSLLGRVKAMVPPQARRKIADSLPWWLRDKLGAHLQASQIDWSRTRAFALPTDLEGCIRINLKGREPEGTVEPGAEYEALCEELRTQLLELTNPATGRAAVHEVWLRNQVFPGPMCEHLPDVVVSWNDEAPIAALESPRLGLVEEASPDPRTGTHSTAGFLLAQGAGIPAGGAGRGHVDQVAPTALRLLGVDATAEMDGRPLEVLAAEVGAAPA